MVFTTIWVHRRVQPVQKLTTLQKKKPLPRNQDKAQALQSWLHETAPARKEAFEQVRAPRGLIRQMGRWLKWMSWSKLKLTMKYHETMKHSELFDIFDKRSWHQLFFEVPLKPCFTVGLTRWRQAQSHLSSLGSHPIFSVGSGLPFFEHVLRTEFFLNTGYGGVWYIYTTPHYMDLYGTFAGKTYDNTMRLRLLRKLLLDKANMPPMSKTTHFPEAGLSVLLDLQYCQLYSTASWMTKYAAEICRALLPNCYLQHYCIDSVSCL